MFPDVELVRSVQTELDMVIEEGVANIVQLLRNADSGVSSGAARVVDEDDFEAKNRQKSKFRRWNHHSANEQQLLPVTCPAETTAAAGTSGSSNNKVLAQKVVQSVASSSKLSGSGGKLTEKLIAQGLLTKNMLEDLRREWEDIRAKDSSSKGNSDDYFDEENDKGP